MVVQGLKGTILSVKYLVKTFYFVFHFQSQIKNLAVFANKHKPYAWYLLAVFIHHVTCAFSIFRLSVLVHKIIPSNLRNVRYYFFVGFDIFFRFSHKNTYCEVFSIRQKHNSNIVYCCSYACFFVLS